jgi:hypothetical protein
MQEEEEEASMDPWSIFLYGMKAPMTGGKIHGKGWSNFLISLA